MPYIHVNGAELYYEEQGSGSETIFFSHGLLWSCRMFDGQVAALRDRYRCIAFDHRGQGQSKVTRTGYDMETLYEDAAALIEALGNTPCHFLGLSMGGFVGMRLAARRPELLKSLLLLDTSADPEPVEHQSKYKQLAFIGRWMGIRMVSGPVMELMFGQKFLHDPARDEQRTTWRQRLINNNRIGSARATIGVAKRQSVYDEIEKISVPTLILVGEQDIATPLTHAQRLHSRIAGSQLIVIPEAGHTSTVEEPEAVNAAINTFLANL
ncbi:2-succinyl-6-hydroxy-2,4-cyclohexadiene-1-carboxy late synthase [Dictyobacter alpinus]|uniref:2-succinyl-6-hydroxy-2,4-cyclohexadiene-1-carboxy late synthase n=1 Tax=Dictyobacter alpinus TaxID=2014873 RepID=A0A402B8N9_9CHLR|nr:alpha/beta fold hydrolase [Dictyobacter alpinus]GCE27687.1 2-succinyl-6-hydroxy-2,4-cyclohexadiene-1-carboxy late synthase [Dictyobacter alpinus]